MLSSEEINQILSFIDANLKLFSKWCWELQWLNSQFAHIQYSSQNIFVIILTDFIWQFLSIKDVVQKDFTFLTMYYRLRNILKMIFKTKHFLCIKMLHLVI